MLNEFDLKDFSVSEVKLLDQVKKEQYFCIPGVNHMFKALYECNNKMYSEVVTKGDYLGVTYAIPNSVVVSIHKRNS